MKKIVIVDDDSRMLKLIKNYLADVYELVPMKSGAATLAYLEDNHPDAILLDYMMPALDGPHTLEAIRKMDSAKDIPVIFLTSVTQKNKVEACMAYEPDGYLVKPVAREELLLALSDLFNK